VLYKWHELLFFNSFLGDLPSNTSWYNLIINRFALGLNRKIFFSGWRFRNVLFLPMAFAHTAMRPLRLFFTSVDFTAFCNRTMALAVTLRLDCFLTARKAALSTFLIVCALSFGCSFLFGLFMFLLSLVRIQILSVSNRRYCI